MLRQYCNNLLFASDRPDGVTVKNITAQVFGFDSCAGQIRCTLAKSSPPLRGSFGAAFSLALSRVGGPMSLVTSFDVILQV